MLAALAAMAVMHVPGFVHPLKRVCGCGGFVDCPSCGGFHEVWDDSPEALVMAVHMHTLKLKYEGGGSGIVIGEYAYGRVRVGAKVGTSDEIKLTPEGVAKGMLEALLRAHGV